MMSGATDALISSNRSFSGAPSNGKGLGVVTEPESLATAEQDDLHDRCVAI